MQRRLGELLLPESDAVGLQLEIQRLPSGFRKSNTTSEVPDRFFFGRLLCCRHSRDAGRILSLTHTLERELFGISLQVSEAQRPFVDNDTTKRLGFTLIGYFTREHTSHA